ncbi:MAG: M3 family oligoendopeptidase [Candidatus Thalassarchaeaceae archaeon]|nr:M3 family oligoendopeptidase [Candidatus Thalassarchaeaceae archaeon]
MGEDFANLDATQWSQLEPLYQEFLNREINSPKDLEEWLLELGRFDAYVGETGSMLYVNMTCDTEDEEVKNSYFDFVENVEPELAKIGDLLNRKLAESPYADGLDAQEYKVLLRDTRMDLALFRKENIPLGTELTKLGVRYKEITAAMTVEFDGEERTMQQMGKYLQVSERDVREAAYKCVGERRFEDANEIDQIYEKMIALRHQVSQNAGYENYRDYIFDAKHRFDYSPVDCETFHDAVETICVPLMRDIDETRRKNLALEALRMWDLSHDVHGRDPLKPFTEVEEMVAGTSRMFHKLSPKLGIFFDSLRDGKSLDLDSRKGKAPGGYQLQRDHSRKPFIFMNATGLQRDLETMVHEAGHAFHSIYADDLALVDYRSAPLEFCEVAAMSMEMLTYDFLGEFYSNEDANRAIREHLEGIVSILGWIATIDAFQHWIYTNPDHSREERHAKWLELGERFGSVLDWSGFEDWRKVGWQKQLHLFSYPFYYIEYGIAQLGALQMWLQYRSNSEDALENYAKSMRLGGSRPLPELFEAAGMNFDFGRKTVAGLIDAVREELAVLPE